MRNILLSTVAVTMIAAAPAMAQSEPNWYGSLGYSHLGANDADVDLGAITGRIGTKLTPYFGIEGEGSIGVRDDSVGPVDVELEHDLAAYAVGFLPVTPNLELIGRVGYGTTSVEASSGAFAVAEDGESINYGVGAQYNLDTYNGIRADWTRRDFRDDGGEADVWSLNYVRRF